VARKELTPKEAWKAGFKRALVLFSAIEAKKHEQLTEEAWEEIESASWNLFADSWNQRRIAHRDEG